MTWEKRISRTQKEKTSIATLFENKNRDFEVMIEVTIMSHNLCAILKVSTNRFSAKIDQSGFIFHMYWFVWNFIAHFLVWIIFFKNPHFSKKNDNLLQKIVFMTKKGGFFIRLFDARTNERILIFFLKAQHWFCGMKHSKTFAMLCYSRKKFLKFGISFF